MANTDKPNGLIPVKALGGNTVPVFRYPVSTSNNVANLAVGDPVNAAAEGAVEPITTSGTNPTYVVGVVTALYDTNGIPIGHPSSAVSTKYLPSATAGYADVALALPSVVFQVQADSGTALSVANIFNSGDLVVTRPDTTTGRSQVELDSSGVAAATAQCMIVGKVDEPGNSWAEHVDVLVVFNESIWNGATSGV